MREMFVNNFSTVAVASSKAVEKKIQHLKKNFFVVDDDGKNKNFFFTFFLYTIRQLFISRKPCSSHLSFE